MTDDADVPPKVTPYLLRRAEDLCPRRLDHEHRGALGNEDPVNRGRVRGAFLDAARTAHTLGPRLPPSPWRTPPMLSPEETAVFDQAVHWYVRLFGDRETTLFDHDLDRPSEVDGLDTRLGGWVDLTVVAADGVPELRQLDFWGGRAPVLADDWAIRLALLRLAEWLGPRAVRVSWTDLLHGVRVEDVFDADEVTARSRAALDERLVSLRARAATGEAHPGRDCPTCRFHKGCPVFPRAMVVRTRRGARLPGVLSVTPSALESWHRCRRAWWNQYALGIPSSDDAAPGVHGQQVHGLLRVLHRSGACDGPERVDDVVAAHDAGERVRAELHAHARRCPTGATSYGHEFTRVRLHPRAPSFIGSARIDAAWIHDGMLDVRDYKTGGVWYERVGDDPRARLQAWVMAPVAEDLGLALRIRYEHLAAEVPDDPDDWMPDAEDLEGVDRELVTVVAELRAETEWRGVADAEICRTCRYRSICPDSAAPGVPAWARVDEHSPVADARADGPA